MFAPRVLPRPLGFNPSRSAARGGSANPGETSASGWADPGWYRLSLVCLGLQVLLFGMSLALYRATAIEVQWSSDAGFLALVGALLAAWMALLAMPGDSLPRRRVAEGVAAAIL